MAANRTTNWPTVVATNRDSNDTTERPTYPSAQPVSFLISNGYSYPSAYCVSFFSAHKPTFVPTIIAANRFPDLTTKCAADPSADRPTVMLPVSPTYYTAYISTNIFPFWPAIFSTLLPAKFSAHVSANHTTN